VTVPMTRCLNTLDEIMGVPGEGVTPVVAESAKENDRGIQPSNRDVPIGTLTICLDTAGDVGTRSEKRCCR